MTLTRGVRAKRLYTGYELALASRGSEVLIYRLRDVFSVCPHLLTEVNRQMNKSVHSIIQFNEIKKKSLFPLYALSSNKWNQIKVLLAAWLNAK